MSSVNVEWSEKYRPKLLSEIVGNAKPVSELSLWAKGWQQGTPSQRAAILYGKPGIGKTTAAHALAHDLGWDLIELNASDQRTAAAIQKVAGSASTTSALCGGIRLIVLDEADNIHGTADRGGAQALAKIIKNTSQPILLTANDLYGVSQGIKSLCVQIPFRSLQSRSIATALKKICSNEGVACEPDALIKIAESAHGDIRSAINDLQAVAEGMGELHAADVVISSRDPRDTIFDVLKKIFRGKNIKEALDATYNIDETPDSLIAWVDENLPAQYRGEDVTCAMHALSRADLFLGRVQRRQNYRMWRYAGAMMTAGVVVSRSREYQGARFMPPSRWRMLRSTRTSRQTIDEISWKIGVMCQVSQRYARLNLIPFVRILFTDRNYAVRLATVMNLDPDEIAHILGSTKGTKKVKTIYQDAQESIEAGISEDIELFGKFSGSEATVHAEVRVPTKKPEKEPETREKKPQTSLFDF